MCFLLQIPELSSSHKDDSFSYSLLVLQMLGISLGIGIMMCIALYENDLKMIFTAGGDTDGGIGH